MCQSKNCHDSHLKMSMLKRMFSGKNVADAEDARQLDDAVAAAISAAEAAALVGSPRRGAGGARAPPLVATTAAPPPASSVGGAPGGPATTPAAVAGAREVDFGAAAGSMPAAAAAPRAALPPQLPSRPVVPAAAGASSKAAATPGYPDEVAQLLLKQRRGMEALTEAEQQVRVLALVGYRSRTPGWCGSNPDGTLCHRGLAGRAEGASTLTTGAMDRVGCTGAGYHCVGGGGGGRSSIGRSRDREYDRARRGGQWAGARRGGHRCASDG
jgi:hypothetical protein